MAHELDYQKYLAWTYFSSNALDRVEFQRLEQLMQNVTMFIDVGASHGVYTYYANQILKDAQIIAIEADPERYAILVRNVAQWLVGSSNSIRCIHAAASDEVDRHGASQIDFYRTGTQISGGLFTVPERSDDYTTTSVPVICLDDFFDSTARTLVKIDVEGAELRVLRGAMRHIESGQTRFFTEISWWGDRTRRTRPIDVLLFCFRNGLKMERRLRSDYLLTPQPAFWSRLGSVIGCLPPLLTRTVYNAVVPSGVRRWRERRENRLRLSRFTRT